MLLTALAATVVVLPWTVDGILTPSATTGRMLPTLLAQQPLTGLGGGESIREVSQATPFSMVALTGTDLTGTSGADAGQAARWRLGPWYEADTVESNADDAQGGGPRGTDRSSSVQRQLSRSR